MDLYLAQWLFESAAEWYSRLRIVLPFQSPKQQQLLQAVRMRQDEYATTVYKGRRTGRSLLASAKVVSDRECKRLSKIDRQTDRQTDTP